MVRANGGWWAIPMATLVVAIITVGGQWWNHRAEIDAKMLEIGISILRSQPAQETQALRSWAIDLINKHGDVPLGADAQRELRRSPLPGIIYPLSWSDAVSDKYCDQWQHNADGSWTQKGAAILPNGMVIENNTFSANTAEARTLEQRCKH
jgi:hypothetical protein